MDAIWNYHTQKRHSERTQKKEPPPSKDGSSSCLLLHLSEPITAASARLWMPSGANLHLGTDEGRFSLVIGSHTPSDYADMPKAPVISYSAPSPMRIFRTIPMPFVKEGRAANHKSYAYAVGTSLPMVLHYCLACLQ